MSAIPGWPVFPCCPDQGRCPDAPGKCRTCKAPLTVHGFKDASTDPAVIRGWWDRWPGANVAVATGAPGPDVLDVDVKPGGSGWAALNRLKRAGLLAGARMLVRTPRGGLHVYFAGTGQSCGSLPRHCLDFRSHGGYVIAPPSRVHGKAYEVLDCREAGGRLDWAAVKRVLDPPRPRKPAAVTWHGGELPAGVQRALAADAADRSKALFRLVGACVRAGMGEDAIYQLAGSYQPAQEKYGLRLDAEIARCLHRIGTP